MVHLKNHCAHAMTPHNYRTVDAMNRRRFIENAVGSALALAAIRMPDTAFSQTSRDPSITFTAAAPPDDAFVLRGVNLRRLARP